ncbi:MAG TPA: SDR family oxidoreductase [Gammaproteobacteria bacterium]|nr:SDR family oxidoreductase [Gammaproteobacteria bacterium]
MADHTHSLQQQVALVTGASTGIGRQTAFALAEAGATVVVNYIGAREPADEVVGKISADGGRALAIEADISREDQVEAMFKQAIDRFGTVHILVNNAGIEKDGAFTEMTLADWQKVIDVNLTGQFLCSRAAIREYLRRGPQPDISKATGKIVCISSVHQRIPWAKHANYAASKGGVMLLVQTLAQEFASRKIRVNSVAPGAIKTAINHAAWATEDALDKLLEMIPYGRIGDAEDVGNAVVWLCSDAADYVTGTTLVVDGGMTLYPSFSTGDG